MVRWRGRYSGLVVCERARVLFGVVYYILHYKTSFHLTVKKILSVSKMTTTNYERETCSGRFTACEKIFKELHVTHCDLEVWGQKALS